MDINPLLNKYNTLPAFSEIRAEHVVPALEQAIEDYKKGIDSILDNDGLFTWNNLFEPLMDLDDAFGMVMSTVSHLNSVAFTDEFQEAYDSMIPACTEFNSWLSHHQELYDAVLQVAGTESYATLTPQQQRVVDLTVKAFERGGIDLPEDEREKLLETSVKLGEASSLFSKNCLKATTEGWFKHVTDISELDGLPDYAIESAKQEAEKRELSGWVITLQQPSVSSVLTKSTNRELRKEVYTAYVTTASEVGPDAGKWDNTELVNRIVNLKTQRAKILGFNDYASFSLDEKMAKDSKEVFDFLNGLVDRVKGPAESEYVELEEFAIKRGLDKLEPWDIGFYAEQMRETHFSYNENDLREYLTCDNAVKQMMSVANDLYGITFREAEVTINSVCQSAARRNAEYPVEVWDKHVKFFRVYDEDGEHIASFYLDLFARSNKRSGAWMAECVNRRTFTNGVTRVPVAYLNCNFNPPSKDIPSLLSMDDIETLFHEFGHGLHHMLTVIDYPDIGGISNVPWDAVELPSQFMEHFCWHKTSLAEIGKHYKTGEDIPDHLINKVLKSKTFRCASALLRQLEFGLFDMTVYANYDGSDNWVQTTYRNVNTQVAVVPAFSFNRFYTSFGHIFGGGYSAGYYSYLWAEVLSSDVFAAFEEHGNIFSRAVGIRFLDEILSMGGSQEFSELFENFRGRQPDPSHLLRHRGVD